MCAPTMPKHLHRTLALTLALPTALLAGCDLVGAIPIGSSSPTSGTVQVADGGTQWTGPYPVVIAAGAFAPAFVYDPMVSRLAEYGFEAHIYVIPTPLRNIEYTAPTLAAFVDDVLARTGAPKVGIVSHSQGGLLSRYFIRYLGGGDKVDTLVSLSGLHYGSTLANIPPLLGITDCLGVEICQQLLPGSNLLELLNEPQDVDDGVHFVNITSEFEELAVPYTNNFHRDVTMGDVTNFAVQEQCPLRIVEHLTLATDGATAHAIVDGLSRKPIDITDNCLGWNFGE